MFNLKLQEKTVSILVSNYFSICGGAEKQFNMIADKLSKLGYEVTIITRNKKSKKDELTILKDIKVFSVYVGEGKLSKYKYIFKSLRYLLKSPYQNTIISSQYGSNSIIAVLYSLIYKTKVIARGSGREIEIIEKNIIKRVFFKILSKKINYIVAINHRLENKLKSVLGIKSIDKIKYISNSVTLGNQVDIHKNESIICISRIENIKGIDILLEVWRQLEEKDYNIPLLIIGNGSERKELKNKYSFLRNVEWKDETSNIEQYIDTARCMISTSRYEGISNSILESMAKGVPIIATKNYGNIELIENNITGILTSFKIEDIIESIVNLYNDKDKLSYLSNNSMKYIEKERSVEDMIDKYLNIIEKVEK